MGWKWISGFSAPVKLMPKSASPVSTRLSTSCALSSCTRTRIFGNCALKRLSTSGRKCHTADGTQANVTVPVRCAARSATPSTASSRPLSASRTFTRNTCPTLVSCTRRVVRSNSLTPSASSSFSMRRLSAGCDRNRSAAAWRKLLRSATATKACKS
ncbi:hypothetical protein D3C72_1716660 [compost metagenome]